MKLRILMVVLVLALAFASATPVAAQGLPFCHEAGMPGNSEYAQHHIMPLAHAGNLGAGGHVPGAHHGYSACK